MQTIKVEIQSEFDERVYWSLMFSTSFDSFLDNFNLQHPEFNIDVVEHFAKTKWPGNYKLDVRRLEGDYFELVPVFNSPNNETWCRLSWKTK